MTTIPDKLNQRSNKKSIEYSLTCSNLRRSFNNPNNEGKLALVVTINPRNRYVLTREKTLFISEHVKHLYETNGEHKRA